MDGRRKCPRKRDSVDATQVIVTALAEGAAASLLASTSPLVKDCYLALKSCLQARFPELNLQLIEAAPQSTARRAALNEGLLKTTACQDADVVRYAAILHAALRDGKPEGPTVQGVRAEDLKAGSVSIETVTAEGTGSVTAVAIKDSQVSGDVSIRDIHAVREGAGASSVETPPPEANEFTPTALASLRNVTARDVEIVGKQINIILPPQAAPLEAPAAQAKQDAIIYQEPEILQQYCEKLFGREELIVAISQSITECSSVLLCGMGGAGKTALAAAVADAQIRGNSGPVLWLACGSAGIDVFYEAIARLAGRLGHSEREQEIKRLAGRAKVQAVSEFLTHDEPVGLIVLDDARDGRVLRELLTAIPDATPALVTSRRHLPVDRIIDVPDLPPKASLDLLCFHGGPHIRRDPAAAALCLRLGHHAYALEIAGARLKVDGKTPAELLDRIGNAPDATTMPEDYAEQGRESVKALLEDSVHELDEVSRAVLLAFGALPTPGATAQFLATFLERDVRSTQDALDTLVRRSLARREQNSTYYLVHDLTFSYVSARFRESGRDFGHAVSAVRRYVVSYAHEFELLGRDMPNLLGVAHRAAPEDRVGIISYLVIGSSPAPDPPSYLDARGHTPELLAQLDAAIGTLRDGGAAQAEQLHYLLGKRGNAYLDRGDLDNAFLCYQAAMQTAPSAQRKALLLGAMGKARAAQGQADEADRWLQEGYELAKANADVGALCYILEQRTTWAGWRGDFEAARRFAVEAVEANRNLGDPVGQGYALLNLGSAELELKQNFDLVLTHHREALGIAKETGHRELQAWALQSLGEDELARGNRREARAHFTKAHRLFSALGMTAAAEGVKTLLARCQDVEQ
jgi:tetratricopeptide (TPR) repeat protein